MKNAAKFGIAALLLIGLVASGFAFSGKGFGNEEARDAIDSGDFEAWKEAKMSDLTEERFGQMRERHQEMSEKREGMGEKRAEMQAIMDEACETGEIPEGLESPMADRLEENFDAVCELHEARQNGAEPEELKEIAEELCINGIGKNGFGRDNRINKKG
jgi:hypothetical protein